MALQLHGTPWSMALIPRSFIWDFVLINKRCLLLTMGSGRGKTHIGKGAETRFVVEDKHSKLGLGKSTGKEEALAPVAVRSHSDVDF